MTEFEGEEGFPLPDEVAYQEAEFVYSHPDRPIRNKFLPWHRPRKQYVREKQWTNAVADVMKDRDQADKLKYIGLPGIDLLDLRQILRTVCEPTGRKLQYIGFDLIAGSASPDATELNISQSELDARACVHQPSGVRPDDLRYVGKRSTGAWKAVREFGHVDVVNFDLTTTLFDGPPYEEVSYLAALKEVLALQAGNPRPWVLLLTTKVDRQDMNDQAVNPLLARFRDSLAECPELEAIIAESGVRLPEDMHLGTWDAKALRVSILSAMLQWIHGLVNGGAMAARVRLSSCFFYTSFTTGGSIDMVSMVIRFNPQPTDLDDAVFVDRGEDECNDVSSPMDDTCSQFASHYQRIANGADIDKRIQEDATLRSEMVRLAADLLEEARYSRPDFLEWAETQSS
ncbi:hypothetical protein [Terrabacter sp. NPDC080008]|uniref:PP_RS20740 family protein n=1 Tax=Terrabacter sp. NPDC080008 TaxID=3155176 RepID=UPI00345020FC